MDNKKMRILIAEDDKTSRVILNSILTKWDFDVIAVENGKLALNILQNEEAPKLVLLDWNMPEMDGLEVIRLARAEFTEQPPYIILLTSKDEKGDIHTGLETGANDYIKKPFDNEELFARIRVGQRTVEIQTRLYESQQKMEHLANHDPLTGMLNRRAILDQLTKELSRSRREGIQCETSNLSIGFFDIDHFKKINDQYGHHIGDEVLKGIAGILTNHLRIYDSFGRIGGDEFLVLVPGMGEAHQKNLFERLSTEVADNKIATEVGELRVTISVGVVMADANSSEDQLLDSADTAMYKAKREGGNRVFYQR